MQKGSNVDVESFTFDFNFNRSLTELEVLTIEDTVNKKIIANQSADTKLMKIEDAKNSGAEALFGEKYDAEVRVVKIGSSIELCGGTHVSASGDIGLFKIISEKSVASGIRRIEAKTANFAIEYSRNQQINLEKTINSLQQDLKNSDKEINNLKKQITLSDIDNIKSVNFSGLELVINIFKNCEAKDLREIANEFKKKEQFKNNTLFLLFSVFEDKVSVIIALSSDLQNEYNAINLLNSIITIIGGKNGGGKPDFAMGGGNNEKNISQAIEAFKSLI
jgi:alanyl-tRNA synthetase